MEPGTEQGPEDLRAALALMPDAVAQAVVVAMGVGVREERKQSPQVGELVKALCKARLSFGEVVKDRTATIPGKDGKKGYEYAYATLDSALRATTQPLAAAELLAFHSYEQSEGRVAVTCRLVHSSEQFLSNALTLDAPRGIGAQVLGGLLTYLRRYTYFGLLGLAPTDDDDGSHLQQLTDGAANRAGAGGGEGAGADLGVEDVARLAAEDPAVAFAEARRLIAAVNGCGDISEPRLRRLYALAWKDGGWTSEQLDAAAQQLLGLPSPARLPWKAYDVTVELFSRTQFDALAAPGRPASAPGGQRHDEGVAPEAAPVLPTWREAWDKISKEFRALPEEAARIGAGNATAVVEGLARGGWTLEEVKTVLVAELGAFPENLPADGTNPPILRKVQKAFRVYSAQDVGAGDRERYGWPPPRHEEEPPFGDEEPRVIPVPLFDISGPLFVLRSLGDGADGQAFPETADEAWESIRAALAEIGAAQPDILVAMTPDDRMELFRPANNGNRSSGDVDGLAKHWLGCRVEKLPSLAFSPVKRLLQTFPSRGPGKEKILGDLPGPGEKPKPAELAALAERCVADGLLREDEVRHSGEKGKVTRDDLEQALALVRDRALMEAGRGGAA